MSTTPSSDPIRAELGELYWENQFLLSASLPERLIEEIFEITSADMTDYGLSVTGTLTFDRQKYDVAWVHYMKDMVLSDDIALNITLVASK